MSVRSRVRRVASGAGVVLATTGLSTCRDGGAVDPPPAPFECTDVGSGQNLTASATLNGTALQLTIWPAGFSTWVAARVTEVVGGTARPVAPASPLLVVIDLADDTVTSGSFRLSGTLRGTNSSSECTVSRTFGFRIGVGGVVVSRAEQLPLPERQPAHIALVSREGRQVVLEATTEFRGPTTVAWTVTGGQILSRDGPRLRWRLPAHAGVYQAELVADYGPLGFAFDALVLEVV
jgi:hypothetical protein